MLFLLEILDLPGDTVLYAYFGLVLSCYLGGIYPGVLSASLISSFSMWHIEDRYHVLGVVVTSFAIAAMVGILEERARRRAKMLDELLYQNSGILKEGLHVLRLLIKDWDFLSDRGHKRLVQVVEGNLGNLLGVKFGFEQLRNEMKEAYDLALKEALLREPVQVDQSEVSRQSHILDKIDREL